MDNFVISWNVGVMYFEEILFVFINLEGLGYENYGGYFFCNKGLEYMDLVYMIVGMWIFFVSY